MDGNSVIVIREAISNKTFTEDLIGNVVAGIFIVLAAYIAYRLGLRTYFKKREHEQIIKRYLEEGVDRVIAAVDQASEVFIDNYLTAWTTFGQFKKNKEISLPVKFQRFDRHYLELTPYNKIMELVGDRIFWRVIQKLFGFIDAESVFLNGEFQSSLEQVPGEPILKKMENHLKMSSQEFNKYILLIQELQQIVSSLEKQTSLNWANLAQFRNRPEVRESVKRMKEKFGPVLQKQGRKEDQKQ